MRSQPLIHSPDSCSSNDFGQGPKQGAGNSIQISRVNGKNPVTYRSILTESWGQETETSSSYSDILMWGVAS